MNTKEQKENEGRAKVGEKIRMQRLSKSYSQEYMAFSLEISQAAYSKLERDETEITLQRLCDIADILEVPVSELMPLSKYGSAINQGLISRLGDQLSGLWRRFGSKRKASATDISRERLQ